MVEFEEQILDAAARERLKHELDLPGKHGVLFVHHPPVRFVLDHVVPIPFAWSSTTYHVDFLTPRKPMCSVLVGHPCG